MRWLHTSGHGETRGPWRRWPKHNNCELNSSWHWSCLVGGDWTRNTGVPPQLVPVTLLRCNLSAPSLLTRCSIVTSRRQSFAHQPWCGWFIYLLFIFTQARRTRRPHVNIVVSSVNYNNRRLAWHRSKNTVRREWDTTKKWEVTRCKRDAKQNNRAEGVKTKPPIDWH